MNKKKSFTIGVFIVGAIVLVFLALLFFSGGQYFSQKERIIMYFDGSVQGLQVGAPIKLKGVVLGEITEIQINFQSDDKPVLTAVTADLALQRINRKDAVVDRKFFEDAITQGLRAQLNFQSFLTGLLYVELDFFPESPATIYGFNDDLLEFPTVATGFEQITKNLQELNLKAIADNLDQLTSRLNNIVNTGIIEQTLGSVKVAADNVAIASQTMGQDVSLLRKDLNHTTTELNKLLVTLNQQTPVLAKELQTSMQRIQQSMTQLDKATDSVHQSLAEDGPLVNQLTDTLEEISRSATAFRALSETIDQQPEALLRGKKTTAKDE